jgi:sulfur-oxidizing protein SoxB
MSLTRREFVRLMGLASAAGMLPRSVFAAKTMPSDMYEVPRFGNVRLLHFTDCHAQLLPVYFREPNVNLGIADAYGRAPHLVGHKLLEHFGVAPGGALAHAYSYLDFNAAAERFGKVGGFAHLATLVKRLRGEAGDGNSLLMDGGDTWQGSGTAYWTRGQDMVDACKLLGVDTMVGHWEFTYGEDRVREIVDNDLAGHMDFLAQNVTDTEWGDPVFEQYTIKEVGGHAVAIIGQAFPYTPIANPRYKIPNWSFGINDEHAQAMVDEVRGKGAEVVVLLSHNGMDVDLKMASRVSGLDVILGGHTHDGMPAPTVVSNSSGKTLVCNAGSQGKFLGCLDFKVSGGGVKDFQYRLLPVFSDFLPADAEMAAYVENVRKPYAAKLGERLATTEQTLYRRGNFNGTFDQVIVDALVEVKGADAAFSPGFRWGTTVPAGHDILFEHVMDQTGLTYPKVTLTEMSGETVHRIMEDVCDNLFNTDPYYQQGGDMVRVGNIDYVLDPTQGMGKRITEVHIGGKPMEPKKTYLVAGWASVQEQPDSLDDIWDVVATYLRDVGHVRIDKLNIPKLKNVRGNPGLADYEGEVLS